MAALVQFMKRRRERFLALESATVWVRIFSATAYALWTVSHELMVRHCRGRVLDAGAGYGQWKGEILRLGCEYESVDLVDRGGQRPTWLGDVTDLHEMPASRYDTVVCHQVLEHLGRPEAALGEFLRVLRPGGKVILSVPHLSRRHELPQDYYRFTQEGLAFLLTRCGFDVVEVRPYGGLLSFLHHQTSFFFPGLLCGVPLLGRVCLGLNAPLSWGLPWLDRLLDRSALMPLGVVASGQKPEPTAARTPV